MLRSMWEHEALFEACRSAPDDDAPRLVWADAVGGERGELVVIQCDLARGGLAPAEVAIRRRRERELLAAHAAAWAGLGEDRGIAGLRPGRVEFRRGFVEAIELDARAFVAHGEEILDRAPLLRSLTATGLTVTSGDPLARVRALLDAPAFWRLAGLHVVGVGVQGQAYDYDSGFDGHGDEALRLIVDSGALAQLGALGVSASQLTAAGVHHLVASGELPHLEKLWLREQDLGEDAILAVLGRAAQVKSLDLSGATGLHLGLTGLEEIVPALPPVTELHLSGIDEEWLAALGRSRAAATVEELGLSISVLERAGGFRAFPRLRVLDLQDCFLHGLLDDPGRAARDLEAALPSLRRLRLPSRMSEHEIGIVARALGPQLEELHVGRARHELGTFDELAAYVAGELRVDALERLGGDALL